MAVFRGLKMFTKLKQLRQVSASMVPCRGYSAPFRGSIEGINSTWKAQGRMKDHQDSLPCQPVPPLEQTIARFLTSVKCLLDDNEYQRAVKLANEFSRPGGEGENLQQLLIQRADEQENWLADWWVKVAYLGYREPVPLNVNPVMASIPLDNYPGKQGQLRLAAMVIRSQLEHKKLIDNQELDIEKIGVNSQCMIQYHHILGCCRVPGEGVDHVDCHLSHDPTVPRHVTIIHNNHLFHVDVLDSTNTALSVAQIESQLGKVLEQSETTVTPVGMLTSAHRDDWYLAYMNLMADSQNAANFASIQQSLFVLSLDKPIPNYTPDKHYEIVCWSHLAGGGSHLNTGNRWCDKILQYFVNVDGLWGFAYEHSVAEGPPVLSLIHKAMAYVAAPVPPLTDVVASYSAPKRLDFNLNHDVENLIKKTGMAIDKRMNELNIRYLRFDKTSRDIPFKKVQIYPDGFIQANIQLAHYKMYGHLVSTYESGSLRKFRLGRTDTIRSASVPVLEWCKAMTKHKDSKQAKDEKISLLREATAYHNTYTSQVSQGQGIDRHLLGLKLMALEAGLKMPQFLVDPIYTNSTHWVLSTTTVPIKDGGVVVFGPVVPEGYGIYYNRQKDWIDFGISTWNNDNTDIDQFRKCLSEALDESFSLFQSETNGKL